LIGAGRLASALVAGRVGADAAKAVRIIATDRMEGIAEAVAAQHGIGVRATPADVAAEADLVILLVKPQDIAAAAREVATTLRPGACVASAAAGVELATIRAELADGTPAARFMPNIPVAVGGGAVADRAVHLILGATELEEARVDLERGELAAREDDEGLGGERRQEGAGGVLAGVGAVAVGEATDDDHSASTLHGAGQNANPRRARPAQGKG
jgi:pyrroline-5-carboxylate reductase